MLVRAGRRAGRADALQLLDCSSMLRSAIVTMLLAVPAISLAPSVASAKRLANPGEKAAIVAALTSPTASCAKHEGRRHCESAIARGIPLRCTKVYVSTVDGAWGSEIDLARRSCLPWTANGIAIVQRVHGRWRFVTAGSAFVACPIRAQHGSGTIPGPIARDLTGAC
jgi:hypothetical protein